jgi:hypothetical protein
MFYCAATWREELEKEVVPRNNMDRMELTVYGENNTFRSAVDVIKLFFFIADGAARCA